MWFGGHKLYPLALEGHAPYLRTRIDRAERGNPPIVASVAAAQTVARTVECAAGDENNIEILHMEFLGSRYGLRDIECAVHQRVTMMPPTEDHDMRLGVVAWEKQHISTACGMVEEERKIRLARERHVGRDCARRRW